MTSGDDYLERTLCEAHERGKIFLGGFPPVRLVVLSRQLRKDGNVDMLVVKETAGVAPQYLVVEMIYGSDGMILNRARFATDDEVKVWRKTNAFS